MIGLLGSWETGRLPESKVKDLEKCERGENFVKFQQSSTQSSKNHDSHVGNTCKLWNGTENDSADVFVYDCNPSTIQHSHSAKVGAVGMLDIPRSIIVSTQQRISCDQSVAKFS